MSTTPNDREMRMPFGRHKGSAVKDLPGDYLRWLATIELRDPLRAAVTAALSWKAAPVASGIGSTTPEQGKPVLASHVPPGEVFGGVQRTLAGVDAPKPKSRAWRMPEGENLRQYYTPQGPDDIPW